MKNILFVLILSLFTVCALATKPHKENVPVNTEKSVVKWKGSKITESHDGIVKIDKGVLVMDHGTLVGGQFSINMSSIQTTDIESEKYRLKLDKHLKNEDFFDVKKFPNSVLTIKAVEPIEGDEYMVNADLTIKGITHSIDFISTIKIKPKNLIVATAKIKIDRTKWGIIYKSGNFIKDLGDKAILDEIVFDVMLSTQK